MKNEEIETRNCPICERPYTPHPAYRNKAPVCDPHGTCGGAWDEREEWKVEVHALKAELAAERAAHTEREVFLCSQVKEARRQAESLRDSFWEEHLSTLDDPSDHDGLKPVLPWEPSPTEGAP